MVTRTKNLEIVQASEIKRYHGDFLIFKFNIKKPTKPQKTQFNTTKANRRIISIDSQLSVFQRNTIIPEKSQPNKSTYKKLLFFKILIEKIYLFPW